jgi:hypothetical protein
LLVCNTVPIVGRVHESNIQGVSMPLHRRFLGGLPVRAVVLAASAAVTIAAFAAMTAQGYSPPKGIPDLAKMTLQPSDLAPGATLLLSSYFDPGTGLHLRAEYNRDWGAAKTTGGVKLEQLQTQITLAASTPWARTVFGELAGIYGASGGHQDLVADVDSTDGSSATVKDAHFGKLRSIGVGQQSLYESATIATKGSTLAVGFAWVRVGAGLAFLVVLAPRPPLADSVTIGLARTLAAHMGSVLGE